MRAISQKLTARPKQTTRKKCSIQSKIVSHSVRQYGGAQREGHKENNRARVSCLPYLLGGLFFPLALLIKAPFLNRLCDDPGVVAEPGIM